jgi:hypothetical protein
MIHDLMIVLLTCVSEIAPHVHDDLMSRKGGAQDDASLKQAARSWVERWHLCGAHGPCDWAVMIAYDTLKYEPMFGWNLNTFLVGRFDAFGMVVSNAPTDRQREFEVTISERTFTWEASRESIEECEERILRDVAFELRDQLRAAEPLYNESRTVTRSWMSDRPLVWFIRHFLCEESFSSISRDSERYLQEPMDRRGKPYPLSGIIRDVEEMAAQLGLRMPPGASGGRPKGRKDEDGGSRRRAKRTPKR